ncbi:HEXXH motif-containing putative peptide modification protein [Streptomyces sp. NPDC056656]|uniref:aKG-HExxH-type peptide beta-hydroxylase n=1 Tax=Streptomyces sp. NPDC056656 TaxID=3345895 RepID=UPI0036BF2A4F
MRAHTDDLQERISSLLPALPTADVGTLSELDDQAWIRILLAPAMSNMLRKGGAHAAPHLMSAAMAERLLERSDTPDARHFPNGGRSVQTALGDHLWQSSPAPAGGYRHSRAPSVRGIVIDGSKSSSARGLARLDDPFEGVTDHDSHELQWFVDAITRSLDTIASANGEALLLITKGVRVISLRREAQGNTSSSSWPLFPGYLRLWNAAGADPLWLVDTILHEAIHSLLYMVEAGEKWFTDPDPRRSGKVSPWSGRNLPLHSFVHACFVWFGLMSFWSAVDVPGAAAMWRRAAAGFRDDHLRDTVSSLGGVEENVRRALIDVVDRAQRAAMAPARTE